MLNNNIFTNVINSYFYEPHSSLLNGIIFGKTIKNSSDLYRQLKMTGLLHIVVASGTNLTIFTGIVANFTQFFSKRMAILINIIFIIFYIYLVGIQAPIIRAGFMSILTFVALLIGRKTYVLYLLFISLLPVISLHFFYPKQITVLSTLLSYGATLGLIIFGRTKNFQPKNHWEKIKIGLLKELKPTLAAQIFTAPIIFFYFKQISIISPLTNILVAPFIPPLMLSGFLTAIFGKIHYFFGLPFSFICQMILDYMLFIINFFSQIPYGFIQF